MPLLAWNSPAPLLWQLGQKLTPTLYGGLMEIRGFQLQAKPAQFSKILTSLNFRSRVVQT